MATKDKLQTRDGNHIPRCPDQRKYRAVHVR